MLRRILLLLTCAAVLVLPAATARAASTITLDAAADWSNAGTTVDVSGTATCTGGNGTVTVQLRQGNKTGVGSNPNIVCDGAPHAFSVTVAGGPFALGQAQATGSLTAPSGNATTSRTVQLQ